MTFNDELEIIEKAIKEFPDEFALRAFPDDKFRLTKAASFINDENEVMLYTQIWSAKQDRWLDFAKGTVAELHKEVIK